MQIFFISILTGQFVYLLLSGQIQQTLCIWPDKSRNIICSVKKLIKGEVIKFHNNYYLNKYIISVTTEVTIDKDSFCYRKLVNLFCLNEIYISDFLCSFFLKHSHAHSISSLNDLFPILKQTPSKSAGTKLQSPYCNCLMFTALSVWLEQQSVNIFPDNIAVCFTAGHCDVKNLLSNLNINRKYLSLSLPLEYLESLLQEEHTHFPLLFHWPCCCYTVVISPFLVS